MRLIDAEKLPLEPCVPNTFISRDYAFGWNDMLREIFKAEPIEAEPVRHGRWVEKVGRAKCSVCADECWADSVMGYKYCPNCGAKMDGDSR